VQEEHGEALLVMSVIIGTDYNRGKKANKCGVVGVGFEKARKLVKAMLQLHQQETGSAVATDKGFQTAACSMLADDSLLRNSLHSQAHNDAKYALQKIRSHPFLFVKELSGVPAVFQRERKQACATAALYTREEVLWSGDRLDARRFVDAMRAAGMKDTDQSADVLSKLTNLELEKMARYGEARANEALFHVDSIAKPRNLFSVRAPLVHTHIVLTNIPLHL
jgi:hypothetical protein